jgi:signal transduction histidine kinase
VNASAEQQAPWSHVWRITTPSGKTKWLHGRGQPEARDDGTVVWHSLILDITEQKTAEAEAKAALLTAEASNQAKTHFLASMSHEIRTPLNSIIGFAEIMASAYFGAHASPKYQEYSGLIAKSAKHLYGLLGDLLDVSRIEAGEVTLEEETIDVAEAVGFCTTLLNEKIAARAIDLNVVGVEGVFMRADPTRFRQALLNPLANAIRHTASGGAITVRLTIAQMLQIDVIDTGEGMSQEDIRKVEAPFAGGGGRSPYTTQHGAGIGLYITCNILQAHGGRLRITSELGQGTCVSLQYPMSCLTAGPAPVETTASAHVGPEIA